MKESRLLRKTLADTGVKTETVFNSRIAEANALQQSARPSTAVAGVNAPVDYQKTTVNPQAGLLNEANTVYAAQPGQQTVYERTPGQSAYDQGTAVNIDDGKIALNAYNRLTGDNNLGVDMSAQDAAKRLNDPSYKAGIRDASNTGLPAGWVDPNSVTSQGTANTYRTPEAVAQERAAINQSNTQLLKQQQIQKQAQKETADRAAASGAASTAATAKSGKDSAPTKDPETSLNDAALLASVGAAMEGLPGGDLVMQGLQASLQDAALAKAEALKINDMQKDQAQEADQDTQSHLDKYAERYKENRDNSQEFAKEIKDDTDKLLAENQIRDQEKLAWQQQMDTQKAEKLKTDEVTKMSIALALGGGFGSRAGLDQVASAEAEWNKSILNLQKEYAFKKADVGAFYTEKYVQAQQKYREDLSSASKEYDTKLDGLEQQGFASSQARKLAESQADTELIKALGGIRKDHTATVKGYVSDVYNEINRSRDDQRAQETLGWNTLEKAIDDYGSNIPKSLLDRIGRMIPGVDLSDVAKVRTLAQMKKNGGGGGGGSSYSFPSSMMSSTGQPPSFEQFVNLKEKEFNSKNSNKGEPLLGMSGTAADYYKSQTAKFDRSAKAMAQYQKEYNTHLTATNSLNPSEIVKRFARKTMTLTGKQLSTAQTLFKQAMDAKDYEYASQIADDTGDDVDATSSMQFTNALSTRITVNKMAGLIKDFGSTGPVTGKLRNLDPYDDKAVQFNRYITEVVPGLARGIFLEVGVLTDSDVARYTTTVGNPNLTIGQATQAFDDLKALIDERMKSQIDVWDANRKSVGGFKRLYETQPLNVQDAVNAQSGGGFLDSLPIAQ